MTEARQKTRRHRKDAPADTAARPKPSGSRQQHEPDQASQSGSTELDKELTRRSRR